MKTPARLPRLGTVLLVTLALSLSLLAGLLPADAKKDDLVALYKAKAYLTARGASTQVQIAISRWSTDEERETLLSAANEGGPAGLRQAMGEQEEHGWFRVRGGKKITLRYARQIVESGQRRVIVVTEQPIPLGDMSKLGETADRAVSILELYIRDTKANDGRVIGAAELSFNDEGQLQITSFVTEPVRLIELRSKR
jgi:hypothetical protein